MTVPSILDKYPEKKVAFFEYWENLKIIKQEAEAQYYEKIVKEKHRSAIIAVLNHGIQDIDPSTKKSRYRRVLSANEIHHEVEKSIGEEVKKSNLYFHLDKLEKGDFIQVVDTLASGKRNTTFYGRTAKVFSPKFSPKYNFTFHRSSELLQVLKNLNQDVTDQEIQKTLDQVEGFNNYHSDDYFNWIENQGELFTGLDFDFVTLANMFSVIRRYSPTVIKGIQELANLLNVDQINPEVDA
ncbi:MAG: hypothetical protein ACXAB7_15710 [Candidatus Kariarchaeaceae archaeon]|jgi:hypothetical protein